MHFAINNYSITTKIALDLKYVVLKHYNKASKLNVFYFEITCNLPILLVGDHHLFRQRPGTDVM